VYPTSFPSQTTTPRRTPSCRNIAAPRTPDDRIRMDPRPARARRKNRIVLRQRVQSGEPPRLPHVELKREICRCLRTRPFPDTRNPPRRTESPVSPAVNGPWWSVTNASSRLHLIPADNLLPAESDIRQVAAIRGCDPLLRRTGWRFAASDAIEPVLEV